MIQVKCSRSPQNDTSTAARYNSPLSMRRWVTDIAAGNAPCQADGTFRNLRVEIEQTPGGATSWTYTLMVNSVATALTVTISGASVSATMTGTDVAVNDGDVICVRRTGSGAAAATLDTQVTIEFESDNAGESIYGCHSASFASADRDHPFFPDDVPLANAGDDNRTQAICPIAGAITKYSLLFESSATGTAHLVKNGVAQDGAGGTTDTVITVTAGTSGTWTGSLALSPGDTVYVQYLTFVSERRKIGLRFTATTDGQFIVAGTDATALHTTSTTFNNPVAGDVSDGWETTEENQECIGGVTTFTLLGLYVQLSGAPGAGKSYTLSLRRNGGDPAGGPSVTISGAVDTTGTSANTAEIASGDMWAVQSVPSGTPTARTASWAFGATPDVGGAGGRSWAFVGAMHGSVFAG